MTSIAPWLSVRDGTEAVDYYTSAFGAVASERLEAEPGHVVVAHLAVDGAGFWVQEDPGTSPEAFSGGSVRMILSVDDPDAAFARAVDAGATVLSPVAEGNGWRVGRILDPCGHQWEIGRPL